MPKAGIVTNTNTGPMSYARFEHVVLAECLDRSLRPGGCLEEAMQYLGMFRREARGRYNLNTGFPPGCPGTAFSDRRAPVWIFSPGQVHMGAALTEQKVS